MDPEHTQRVRKVRRIIVMVIVIEALGMLGAALGVGLSEHSFAWTIAAIVLYSLIVGIISGTVITLREGRKGWRQVGQVYVLAAKRLRHRPGSS